MARDHVPDLQRVLNQTECMFTWELRGTYLRKKSIAQFRSYLAHECYVPHFIQLWSVRGCLAYELFQERNGEAFAEINQAIEELRETEDSLTQKYYRSCEHILYATKAFMINKCLQDGGWWGVDDLPTLREIVQLIPSKWLMSRAEKAGLWGFKAETLCLYNAIGEAGQGIRYLKRALELDPSESEWKMALLAHLIRNGLYLHGEKLKRVMENYRIPYSLVREPLQLIEEILRDPNVNQDWKISAKYYKAVALEHYIENREGSPDFQTTHAEIDELWRAVFSTQPENPVYIKFGAIRFLGNAERRNESDMNTALEATLRVFEKYPTDKRCRYAAEVVQQLPNNVLESSETAQRIIQIYASQNIPKKNQFAI